MRALIRGVVVAAVLAVAISAQVPSEKAPETKALTSVTALKAEVQQLRDQLQAASIEVARCQATRADVQARYDSIVLTTNGDELGKQRATLEKDIRKELGCADDAAIAWTASPPTCEPSKVPEASKR